jgi:hypothetical protein
MQSASGTATLYAAHRLFARLPDRDHLSPEHHTFISSQRIVNGTAIHVPVCVQICSEASRYFSLHVDLLDVSDNVHRVSVNNIYKDVICKVRPHAVRRLHHPAW